MSAWQPYIDTSLVGSGHLDKASIISIAADSVWAASPNFQLKPDEMKVISSIVSGDEAARDKAYADGLYAGGERYVLTRVDGRSLYARQGKSGLVVTKCLQCILVAHHNDEQASGNASATVERIADHLIEQKY